MAAGVYIPKGASVTSRSRMPSIDLATLCQLIAETISNGSSKPSNDKVGASDTSNLPLISAYFNEYGNNKLHVNLRNLVTNLYRHHNQELFKANGIIRGFMRDAEAPPLKNEIGKFGGKLLLGSEEKTATVVKHLHSLIAKELDGLGSIEQLSSLVCPTLERFQEALAQQQGIKLQTPPRSAKLPSVLFATDLPRQPHRSAEDRKKDIARVLSATESVEGGDWLEKILAGIEGRFMRDGVDKEEIDSIKETIRMQGKQEKSQVRRFLEFLEDEALARVRLQITFKLMEALANQSDQLGLKTYVSRVLICYDLFSGDLGESLPLDVGNVYGVKNNSDLADYLRTTTFYSTLPIWAEWSVQLFEAVLDPNKGAKSKREVSYRFKINGILPETGKSAFSSRLDKLEEWLLREPGSHLNCKRAIAELVFLRLVIPDSIENPSAPSPDEIMYNALKLTQHLKCHTKECIQSLVESLRKREDIVEKMAKNVIEVLRAKSSQIVDTTNRKADTFYIAIQRQIVNWSALKSLSNANTDVLETLDKGLEQVAWFKRIRVIKDPANEQSILASFKVETTLVERSITPSGQTSEVVMSRQLNQPVLPVRFVPFNYSKENRVWQPLESAHLLFETLSGIEFEYDINPLSLSAKLAKENKENAEQIRATLTTATVIVCYLILLEVSRRLKLQDPFKNLALVMLRLQPKSRDSSPSDGNTSLYALTHALEIALSRDVFVKMQGYHTEGAEHSKFFRKRGTLCALEGGFPFQVEAEGTVSKMALISYVTRPCDLDPSNSSTASYFYLSKTYCLNTVEGHSTISLDNVQTRMAGSLENFKGPHLILEEISRLKLEGYSHIILLSHHYGNRHIGRASEKHSPHGSFDFMEDISQRYPDLFIYPLRRDVFPATRLHKKLSSESGFEVLSFDDHRAMYDAEGGKILKSLMPIYTFATLTVVAEEHKPQSGFCTYFYDSSTQLSNSSWSELIRQYALGVGTEGQGVKKSIVSFLRGIHYMESEKPVSNNQSQLLAVLDPYGWVKPSSFGVAGELEVISSRKGGSLFLSLPAVLLHVTKALYGGHGID